MATVIWNMPVVTYESLNTLQIYKDLMTDFNTQLKNVGLLEVPGVQYNNDNAIANATIPSTAQGYNTDHTMGTLYYMLPTGNGKMLFDDIPGQTYKKINKASYDSTPVYLAFRFNLWKAQQQGSAQAKDSMLTVEIYISFDNATYASCGFSFERTATNGTYATTSVTQLSRECFVHMDRNSFILNWASWQYKNGMSTSHPGYMFNWKTHTVHFSLVRNNGNIDVCTPNGYFQNQDTADDDSVSSSFYFRCLNFNQSVRNIQDRTQSNDSNGATFTYRPWLFNMPGVKDGKFLTVPFYASNSGYVEYNPHMTILRQPRLGGIDYVNLITLIDNKTPVQARYLKLGNIVNRYKPYFNRGYQYAYLFEDYTLTTESL